MKVLILLACVTYTLADVDCNSLRRVKVRNQWEKAYGKNAQDRIELGREIYEFMFEKNPKTRQLFNRVRSDNLYSPEFGALMVRVLGGIDICISLLNDEEVLNAELAHLKAQHADRGVQGDHLALFGVAIMRSIPMHVDNFDQDAWHACYGVISGGINA